MKKKNILIFPNDPFEKYEVKGHDDWYPSYFNPTNYFGETFLLYRYGNNDANDFKFGLHLIKIGLGKNLVSKIISKFRIILRGYNLIKNRNIMCIRCYNTSVWQALILAKLTSTPLVISVHNNYNKERLVWSNNKYKITIQETIEKLLLRKSDQIRCVSTALCNDAIRKGADSDKVKLTFNKVKLEKFDGITRVPNVDGFRFLFIGRFTKQKNLLTLIEAFALLTKEIKNISLTLIGDGEERPQIINKILELNIDKDVHLPGFIKNSDLAKFMQSSNCFILPSYFEGFGVVLIEAQAAGLPIIASDIPETKDVVTNDNAILFNPKDANSLKDTMKKIVLNKELQISLSKKSKASSKKFKWIEIEKYEADLYREVLGDYKC